MKHCVAQNKSKTRRAVVYGRTIQLYIRKAMKEHYHAPVKRGQPINCGSYAKARQAALEWAGVITWESAR